MSNYVETFRCYGTDNIVYKVLLKYYSAENEFLQCPV